MKSFNKYMMLLGLLFLSFVFCIKVSAQDGRTIFISGNDFNIKIKQLAGDDTTENGALTVDTSIKHIVRSETLSITPSEENIVSINDSEKPIYAWFANETLYYYSESEILYLNEDSSRMFLYLNSLENVDLSDIKTANVTNMKSMFAECLSLSELDVSGFDTSSVTDMSNMFYECSSLLELDVSNFNTSSVTNMSNMFSKCSSLLELDVSNFNTSSVTDMSSMFSKCISLTSLDVDDWNVSNVTSFRNMFSGTSHIGDMKLVNLDVSKWNTSSAINMTSMFYGMGAIEHLDVSNWDVSNVISFNHMFCDNNKLKELDLSKWNVSSVKTMENMFDDAFALETVGDISHWNTSNLIDAGGMFNGCTKFEENGTIDLSGWDTSNLKVTGEMFRAVPAKIIDLSGWDLSSITNDSWEGAGSGIYYETGNTSSYPGMRGMFLNMSNLEYVYVGTGWVIPQDVNTEIMFSGAPISSTTTVYKVTYDYEGIEPEYYESGETIIFKTNLEKTGYNLIGYKYNNNEYSLIDQLVMPENDIVLTPVFESITYQITYDLNDGSLEEGKTNLTSYTVEDTFTLNNPIKEGYTFTGWTGSNGDIPQEEVTIAKGTTGNLNYTANYTANNNTSYKVEHYKQNIDNDEYTLYDTENLTGTTDTSANAVIRTIEGFEHNTNNNDILSGIIAADGSLTLKVYYDRLSYKLKYSYTGVVPAGATTLPLETTYKYGKSVTVIDPAIAPGYTFSGWSRTGTFEMPAENVTITGSFEADGGTAYKVEYYQQNVDNDNYSLIESRDLTGTTDTEATYESKTYTGFEQRKVEYYNDTDLTISNLISGNGKTNIKIFYDRLSYTVTYSYTSAPSNPPALPEGGTYKYGANVTVAAAPSLTGYTFSGWSRTDTFEMPAENVTITGSFEVITYQIIYNLNSGTNPNDAKTSYTIIDQTYTLPIPTRLGHTFIGWYDTENFTGDAITEIETGSIGNKVYYAKWEETFDYVINTYNVDKVNKYISGINVNTEVNSFTPNITLNYGYGLYIDYKEIDNKQVLYTGGKTRITKGLEIYDEYTNVVTGDVSGDGKINYMDYVKVYNHIRKSNHPELTNKTLLENEYLLAADMSGDGKITYLDYVKVYNKIKELKKENNY